MKLSTDKILNTTVNLADDLCVKISGYEAHLDIGSGHGDLIALLREKFSSIKSNACDYTEKLMQLDDIKVDVVDLNKQNLPYQENAFDLVTCTEVIEHVEHYRETLREIFRVLKDGGVLVLSTPNILNLKSRIRFLISGFYNLFGPLHFRESNLHSTGGHINPVSVFYLIHSLKDAGFNDVVIRIDKRQGTSFLWFFILYLPIKLLATLAIKKERKKYRTIDGHNEQYVRLINCVDVLLGRTIVIGCKKKY